MPIVDLDKLCRNARIIKMPSYTIFCLRKELMKC